MTGERWFRIQGYIEPCRNEKAHEGVCVRTPMCTYRCMKPTRPADRYVQTLRDLGSDPRVIAAAEAAAKEDR